MKKLPNIVNNSPIYGFCFHTEDYKDMGNFYYMIAVETQNIMNVPMNMVAKTIPNHEFAVFQHQGEIEKLGETYQYIMGEWLPKQSFQRNHEFDFEAYSSIDGKDILEIYIPIMR